MSALSDYLENNMLDHLLQKGQATFASPTELYVGLHTANPTDAGGNEITTTDFPSYTRQSISFNPALSGNATSAVDVEWTYDGGTNSVITHIAIYDAATGGNMLWHGILDSNKTLANTDVLRIAAGSLTIGLD